MTMTMIDIIKIMKKDDLNFFEACIILYPEKSFDEFDVDKDIQEELGEGEKDGNNK